MSAWVPRALTAKRVGSALSYSGKASGWCLSPWREVEMVASRSAWLVLWRTRAWVTLCRFSCDRCVNCARFVWLPQRTEPPPPSTFSVSPVFHLVKICFVRLTSRFTVFPPVLELVSRLSPQGLTCPNYTLTLSPPFTAFSPHPPNPCACRHHLSAVSPDSAPLLPFLSCSFGWQAWSVLP